MLHITATKNSEGNKQQNDVHTKKNKQNSRVFRKISILTTKMLLLDIPQ